MPSCCLMLAMISLTQNSNVDLHSALPKNVDQHLPSTRAR